MAKLAATSPNEALCPKLSAKQDGRTKPGGDILIHGSSCSVGYLAMGDQTSEDLFVLSFDTKNPVLPLIISPVDLRTDAAPPPKAEDPLWLPQLCSEIARALADYPEPPRH
jgi:hypothetical protein